VTAIRTPASAGPATWAAGRAIANSAFASPSWSRGASWTVSPDNAGWKNASPVPVTRAVATNSHRCGRPRNSAAASVPCAPHRARSAASMTGRLPSRSAITPPPSRSAAIGTMFAAKTRPSPVAVPPLPSTAKAIATEDIAVPSSEAAYPA